MGFITSMSRSTTEMFSTENIACIAHILIGGVHHSREEEWVSVKIRFEAEKEAEWKTCYYSAKRNRRARQMGL